MTVVPASKLTRKDFVSSQEVRWCPGCGDYAILAQVQKIMPELGVPKENVVFISGIGCSSRFPYYMDTYGFHGIHGRAPTLASGLKIARPEMQVWVITGDGDGLSIGGNHLIHALRRNISLKIILFNNRIYGLTKGQYSPTSELGKKTKSTPFGSIDHPFNVVSTALGSEATFVARTIDTELKQLTEVLTRAAHHRGSALIEVYQNCVVFNDGAFDDLTQKDKKADRLLNLRHGMPLVFGKDGSKGIRLRPNTLDPEVVTIGENGVSVDDILVHDEHATSPGLPFLLSQLQSPTFPTVMGVFRDIERPTYEDLASDQARRIRESKGKGDLMRLLRSGDTWTK